MESELGSQQNLQFNRSNDFKLILKA